MRKVFLLIFLLFTAAVYSQVCIHGTVVDRIDGRPLEYVRVGLLSGARSPVGTLSDTAGRYRLWVTPSADSAVVRFTAAGFTPLTIRLAVPRMSDTIALNVMLAPSTTTLREVTVVDEALQGGSFTILSADLLEDVAGPSSGVEALVKTLPDVTSNNEMSSQYSVRGGSFDENLVYVNGVEIYRPMLVRSGQQEGMSIVNPDMVDHLYFSPGGFDVRYGDKLSSVLDIAYGHPTRFSARFSASLLGYTAHADGPIGNNWSYSVGLRHQTNNYLLSSLDTKGTYNTSYTDLQTLLYGRLGSRWSMQLLNIVSRNRYGLIPESQTTTFGSFMESLELDVYFDGEEQDYYRTFLSAATFSYHPSESSQIDFSMSLQSLGETERYDIQSQYWLYELGLGGDGTNQRFDRGVGTFLEHARNRLQSNILTADLRGTRIVSHGTWLWGLSAQAERIADHLREWKWIDSAGYAMPATIAVPGADTLGPSAPLLQNFVHANNRSATYRLSSYLQREFDWMTESGHQWRMTAGVRIATYFTDCQAREVDSSEQHVTGPLMFSPRLSFGIKPNWEHRDIFLRLSLGVYQQAPFYRENRRVDGSLNSQVSPQQSYQATLTCDYVFYLYDRPFKLTADLYYKFIDHLVPYTVDNLRLRYEAHNNAVGYATGLSIRLNGEWVEGLESWASLSLMKTQENIEGDGLGWLARPTDQRLSFKLFFQDNLPRAPWWRMSMGFVFGTGMPVVFAHQTDRSKTHRLPAYFRVDWNNSVRLSQMSFYKHSPLRFFDEVLVGIEIYNLFNHRNVASYIWVSDYENKYYPVPNYLTARQFNLKVTFQL